jgi:hypothetical protein
MLVSTAGCATFMFVVLNDPHFAVGRMRFGSLCRVVDR